MIAFNIFADNEELQLTNTGQTLKHKAIAQVVVGGNLSPNWL